MWTSLGHFGKPPPQLRLVTATLLHLTVWPSLLILGWFCWLLSFGFQVGSKSYPQPYFLLRCSVFFHPFLRCSLPEHILLWQSRHICVQINFLLVKLGYIYDTEIGEGWCVFYKEVKLLSHKSDWAAKTNMLSNFSPHYFFCLNFPDNSFTWQSFKWCIFIPALTSCLGYDFERRHLRE